MHITLISPPQVFTKSQVTAGVVPPLGILYLSSYLNKFSIETDIIDSVGIKHDQYSNSKGIVLRGLTFQEILNNIPKNTDLIGISSLYSSAYIVTKELTRLIKEQFPSKKIVLGGAHATVLPEFTLRDSDADIIVIGEGELTLLELCQKLDNYKDVKGIVYREGNEVFSNPSRELIENLDDLPFPDRGSIKLENYFNAAEPHGCSASGRWTTILSSRGCPHSCTFCTTPLIWRRRWRTRSTDNVIQEMVELRDRYEITDFHLEDENLGLDKRWLHQFCDSLIEEGLNFTWQPSNGLRVETILEHGLMKKMKDSGCSLVVFTLESASERVRNDIIRKNLDITNVEKAVSLAKKVGIRSTCYFIIGLPDENIEEAKETLNYAGYLARKGLDECVIGLFSMLPGCELFDRFYKQGKIKLDSEFFRELATIGDLALFKSWTEHISNKMLKKLRFYGYLKFMFFRIVFHPLRFIRSICNIVRGKDYLKSERVIRTFIRRFNLLQPFNKGSGRQCL